MAFETSSESTWRMRSWSACTTREPASKRKVICALRAASFSTSGGAAEQIDRWNVGEIERHAAFFNAIEVEDVVDQADEAVAVADGDLEQFVFVFPGAYRASLTRSDPARRAER